MSKEIKTYFSEAMLKDKPKKKFGLIINDGAVTTPKIRDKAVTEEKLADGAVTKDKLGGDALKQLDDNSAALNDVIKHVYPRILMNEDDLNALIEKGGPFEEGMDYIAYEDNG